MWQNLTELSVSPSNLIFRATIVYLSILILLRIAGKKQIGQMGATEFVAILLISNAVQNAMNAGDSSLLGGLLSAVVLIVLSSLISYLTFKSKKMQGLFEGTPTLLIHKGKVVSKHLEKERITGNELKVLLRKQGIHNLQELDSVILEADGTLSITRLQEPPLIPMHPEK